MSRRAGLVMVMVVLACACSEAKKVQGAGGAGSGGSTGGGGGSTGGSASGGSGGSGGEPAGGAGGAGGAPTLGVVVNEVSAAGEDWIELYNPTSAPADIGGLKVADLDGDTMGPKVAEAVVFPPGTSIPPGGYVVVVADVAAPLPGLQTDCLPDGGPSECFHAGFGISKDGDTIYLLDAADVVLETVPVPATVEGDTWGRFPNGSGSFSVTTPTPGEANELP